MIRNDKLNLYGFFPCDPYELTYLQRMSFLKANIKPVGNCRACSGRNNNNKNFSMIFTNDPCERIINQWLRSIPFR